VPHVRLDADDPDRRVVLLETPGAAHGRPGGAESGDEHGDLPTGLLPDFHGRAVIVRGDVVLVVELVDEKIPVRIFALDRVGFLDGPVRPERGGGEAEFRAEGLEDLLAFVTGRFG